MASYLQFSEELRSSILRVKESKKLLLLGLLDSEREWGHYTLTKCLQLFTG